MLISTTRIQTALLSTRLQCLLVSLPNISKLPHFQRNFYLRSCCHFVLHSVTRHDQIRAYAGSAHYKTIFACWDCGIESRRGHGWLYVISVAYCQVEVSATGRSLVQRSPTDCGVSLCVIYKSLRMRRPWPTLGCCARK